MIDRNALLDDLKREVRTLEADLRPTGKQDPELQREHQEAYDAKRTSADFDSWLGDRVTQVAVAWALGTVFVRFCEDNDLIEFPVIAGPGDRLDLAIDLQRDFFQRHPEKNYRDWITQGFEAMKVSPVAAGLFETHNPMWTILPSQDAAKALLGFWRTTDSDGAVVHNFKDDEWNTRFLGDLYQDLSEHAKDTYALLQTPEFVEEFILKYTLDPAIEEFGLEPAPPIGHEHLPHGLRVIDPACGSGHFLLGAFHRLLAAWLDHSPGTDQWTLISHALESVHGVDKNPFAAAIARFRLLLAGMRAGGVARLSTRVKFPLNIAVGDSLLHGKGRGRQIEFNFGGEQKVHTYRTEDIDDYIKSVSMLEFGTYHAVFANPPYITVKDKRENENYRDAYKSCAGKYSLSVPFAERIFNLTVFGAHGSTPAGYTGQITANSFMKREFGTRLIEEYLPNVDLTHVIDTSGVYLHDFGTPTVILFGRRRIPRSASTIRAVLGVRSEPTQPEDPTQGLVWQAIVRQVDKPGSQSEWVTVADLPRDFFAKHPWSLAGGGADEVLRQINKRGACSLEKIAESVGITSFTLEDHLYLLPAAAAKRHRIPDMWVRPMVLGDGLRDWSEAPFDVALFPYDESFAAIDVEQHPDLLKLMWPYRTDIANNVLFGRVTKVQGGLKWSEYGRNAMGFRRLTGCG
ncbi:MAG: BREX-2 system adenine-specific DNA-methyltransferase PglX [Streptosporangiaceae bacterium]